MAAERERRLRHLTQDESDKAQQDVEVERKRAELIAREELHTQQTLLDSERQWRAKQVRCFFVFQLFS